MNAAAQEHTGENSRTEASEQTRYAHIHVQPEPDPIVKELARRRKSMKRTMIAGFVSLRLVRRRHRFWREGRLQTR